MLRRSRADVAGNFPARRNKCSCPVRTRAELGAPRQGKEIPVIHVIILISYPKIWRFADFVVTLQPPSAIGAWQTSLEKEALCFRSCGTKPEKFQTRQDEDYSGFTRFAWADSIWIFLVWVFSGPRTRDVEHSVPRFFHVYNG